MNLILENDQSTKDGSLTYRFPSSLSYSKLSLLSVPGSESKTKQQIDSELKNQKSTSSSSSSLNQSINSQNSSKSDHLNNKKQKYKNRATQHHQSSNLFSDEQDKQSPIDEMLRAAKQRNQLKIRRGARGFGFTLRAIKVYYGDSDYYTIQHLVIQVDQSGPAFSVGLRVNDIITHVNDEVVCGRMHHEIVKLIMSSVDQLLLLRTVQLNETKIKTGGRKRSPSKSKFSRPLMTPKNSSIPTAYAKEITTNSASSVALVAAAAGASASAGIANFKSPSIKSSEHVTSSSYHSNINPNLNLNRGN